MKREKGRRYKRFSLNKYLYFSLLIGKADTDTHNKENRDRQRSVSTSLLLPRTPCRSPTQAGTTPSQALPVRCVSAGSSQVAELGLKRRHSIWMRVNACPKRQLHKEILKPTLADTSSFLLYAEGELFKTQVALHQAFHFNS